MMSVSIEGGGARDNTYWIEEVENGIIYPLLGLVGEV